MTGPTPRDEAALVDVLVRRLFPLHRSVAGPGLRETLEVIGEYLPLERTEVPTGTAVFDWTIPREWHIRDAWIADGNGRRVVDYRASNLHVVSHSVPVPRQTMSLADLRPHLHALPDRPGLVPFRTTYYDESWGFCLDQSTLDGLADGPYEVCIDADLEDGALSFAEHLVPGTSGRDFLLSAHACHPSLANDNLSGIAVAVVVARRLLARGGSRRHGLRVLFAPGTIGTVAWLARNPEARARLAGGLTLVCLGDDAPLTYKRTLRGDSPTDTAAALVLARRGRGEELVDYHPWGYDERQYNSPAFRLPVGSLMRGRHGAFPEYHTSADTPDFISSAAILDAADAVEAIVSAFDAEPVYRSLVPYGEPQLGRRGLYRALGGLADPGQHSLAMLWVLTLADGNLALGEVTRRSGLPAATVERAAAALEDAGLIERVDCPAGVPGRS